MLSVVAIPAFNDNYIWTLYQDDQPDAPVVVVDPGCADTVSRWLEQHQHRLEAILITHHHQDHTGGVNALQQQWNCPVYGPGNSPFTGITQPLYDGDLVWLLDTRFEVRSVPAHTLDHISYFAPDANALFCGDTLFMAGCGRLFEGDAEQMHRALTYFASLPDATAVYCTHEYTLSNLAFAAAVEPDNADIQDTLQLCQTLREQLKPTLPSSIGLEKRINPFMRTEHPDVAMAARIHAEKTPELTLPENSVDTLAVLREWKNRF